MQVKPSKYKLKNKINKIWQYIKNINKAKTSNKQDYDRIE